MDCYWHTRQRVEKGLAYWEITLIPLHSMDTFIKTLEPRKREEDIPLITLMKKEKETDRYIIHFGIIH